MTHYTDKSETQRFAAAVSHTRLEREFDRAHGIAAQILKVCHVVARIVREVAEPVIRAHRIRRTEQVLHSLSNRQLADIGVCRAEINQVAQDCEQSRIGQRNV